MGVPSGRPVSRVAEAGVRMEGAEDVLGHPLPITSNIAWSSITMSNPSAQTFYSRCSASGERQYVLDTSLATAIVPVLVLAFFSIVHVSAPVLVACCVVPLLAARYCSPIPR